MACAMDEGDETLGVCEDMVRLDVHNYRFLVTIRIKIWKKDALL